LLEPVNLLILDEPTNHLDMPSKDVLKEAIKAFDGTAIIVSHDREFLDGLVSKVYEFGHGEVREHLGGIYDYLRAHHADSIHEALNSTGSVEEKIAVKEVSTQSQQTVNKQSYAEHKEQQKKIRKVEKAIKEAEAKIESMEKRKSELDEMLMKPENASNMDLVTEYTSLQKSLDQENDHWFELSQKLEELN
jgi:ATP-binding cassette subfamily F protein 3